jgi:CHAD domain-containing protein
MRIAVKRLRYTMELFKPLYEGALDRVIEAIKQVQTLLGDVHDCDVWITQLDKMLQKQSKRFVRYYRHAGPLVQLQAGLDFLKRDRRRRRDELFSTLVQFWHEQTEAGLWDELAEVIGAQGPVPDAPPTPAAVPRRAELSADRGGNGSPPAAAPKQIRL